MIFVTDSTHSRPSCTVCWPRGCCIKHWAISCSFASQL